MTLRSLLTVLLLATPGLAQAEGSAFKLDAAQSTLSYRVVHKFHEVHAKTQKLQGAAVIKPEGAQVQIRAETASFDSDNASRDSHMKEVTEAATYPSVTLKGTLSDLKVPDTFPAEVKTTLKGQLDFHGKTLPVTAPVTLTFADASHVRAVSTFDISLDAYGVERPSLMLVKVDDACHITAELTFAK
jgi:polyisoprenoid-binding protein YceI